MIAIDTYRRMLRIHHNLANVAYVNSERIPSSTNPWVKATTPGDGVAAPVISARMPAPLTGAAHPQSGVGAPDAADRLPRWAITAPSILWVVGAHGGAGESTLSALISDSRPTEHAWPLTNEDGGHSPRVLLACRSHMSGLKAAQTALREWASGSAPDIELLGLVVVADAPGKLPKPLREFVAILGGGVPRLWRLPWVDAWRLGDLKTAQAPKEVHKFLTDIGSLLS